MTGSDSRLAQLRELRRGCGAPLPAELPPHIQESWLRCLEAGLDPSRPPAMVDADADVLEAARERLVLTRRLALAEMHNLYHQIAGSNFMIALADPGGMVLDTICDDSFRSQAESSNIRPGGLWAESCMGTNALGTVAATGRALTVHGPEHFFRDHTALTCTATPIHGPDGAVAAILDASSDCRQRQRHTQALVRMSALQIENGLFRERFRDHLILVLHSRPEYLRTLNAGQIALQPDGTIAGLNRQAGFLLQGQPLQPGRQFDEVFRTRFTDFLEQVAGGDRVALDDQDGSRFACVLDGLRHAAVARPVGDRARPAAAKAARAPGFVADDPQVAAQLRMLDAAVARGLPILVQGPTGTGKELLARHVHDVSGRKGAFVPVNCAALSEGLIESELFGYREGAFTGARRGGAPGLVLEADGGTLFLDEIGDMQPALQTVLLRLLDDWTVRPVGGGTSRRVDLQLIAATNCDLAQAVEAGRFRADLLYRLNTVEVRLPALAERRDFTTIAVRLLGDIDPRAALTRAAVARLKRHGWPGNIRELRSVLTRLAIAAEGTEITGEAVARGLPDAATGSRDSPAAPHGPDSDAAGETGARPTTDGHFLQAEIDNRILETWEATGGNVADTARRLGISRNTVYRRIKQKGAGSGRDSGK